MYNDRDKEVGEIVRLLLKQRFAALTESEEQCVEAWRSASAANEVLYQELSDERALAKEVNVHRQFDPYKALHKFKPQLAAPAKRSLPKWWYYAAAALLAVGMFWYSNKEQSIDQVSLASLDSIQPGGAKAMITLADGRSITLDDDKEGIILSDSIRYADGRVIATVDKPQLLTVRTPRGGEYKLTLLDGTKVWLNAETTIKYASNFVQGNREVSLEGEAFFDVSRMRTPKIAGSSGDFLPFRVLSAQQEIVVLGTSFNVSAYKSEPCTQTTLVEGSLRVTAQGDASPVVKQLSAGQQTNWDGKNLSSILK